MTVDRSTNAPGCRVFVKPLFAVLLLFFAFSKGTLAQTGTISGTVVDARTGESLPGANVFVENTLLGAASEADGRFTLAEVPVGTYTLRARFIGFQEAVQQVTVTANPPPRFGLIFASNPSG